jgi:hypothetical protein
MELGGGLSAAAVSEFGVFFTNHSIQFGLIVPVQQALSKSLVLQ